MYFIPRELQDTVLPTESDVIQHLLFLKNQSKRCDIGFQKFYELASNDVLKIWKKTNLSIVSRALIRKKVTELVGCYRDVIKNPSHYNENEWNKLFRVCKCKCKCALKKSKSCQCPEGEQISSELLHFLLDQNEHRLLSINDLNTNIPYSNISSPAPNLESDDEYNSDLESEVNTVNSYPSEYMKFKKTNEISLPSFSNALDRCGLSDRFGALLATTFLRDLGMLTIVIDQHKIRRERVKARSNALKLLKNNDSVNGISFDGK